MANPHRCEFDFIICGKTYTCRPTLTLVSTIETEVASLFSLAASAEDGTLKISDCVAVTQHLLAAARAQNSTDAQAHLEAEAILKTEGAVPFIHATLAFLQTILVKKQGGASEPPGKPLAPAPQDWTTAASP